MKKVFLLLFAMVFSANIFAQSSKSDIFNGDVPVTFIGLDFTQAKFIGNAAQYGDAGEITNNALREKYIPTWNDMFTNPREQKNFKVADAVNRMDVSYATDIVDKVNRSITNKDFFADHVDDMAKLDEAKITKLLKKYNFDGKKGIGLIFFVEGMRKGVEKGDPSYARVMVTFVDMSTKTVLFTKEVEGKAGGFGFKNFWAGAWKSVLKEMREDWKKWKRD